MLFVLLLISLIQEPAKPDTKLYIGIYTSQYCGPCIKFKSECWNKDEVKNKIKEQYHVYMVDTNNIKPEFQALYNYSRVTIVPSFIIYELRDGKLIEVKRKQGYVSKEDLFKFLERSKDAKDEKSGLGSVNEKG